MAYLVDAATNQQRGMISTSADDVKFFLLMLFLRGKNLAMERKSIRVGRRRRHSRASIFDDQVSSHTLPPPHHRLLHDRGLHSRIGSTLPPIGKMVYLSCCSLI
jgi:hypothetical protein